MHEHIIWSPGVTIADVEKQTILKAFRFYKGNKTATANSLGISIRTLDSRLEEYLKKEKEEEIRNETTRHDREQFLARQRGNPTTNEFGASVLTSKPSNGPNSSAPLTNATIQGQPKTGGVGSSSGVRVEPTSQVRPQQAMSMPERKEVQGVSPKHPSQGYPKRHR